MNDDMNVRVISWLSAGAVALIALFSFAISYVAQRELAVAAGIHPWLTYIFPLVIDGFIVVASLSVLLNSLVGESSKYQWAMVGVFTVLSIAFNAAHAYDVLLDITVVGLPVTLIPHVAMPVALFFGFEMLMRQVHSAIERNGTIKSLSSLRVEFDQLRRQMDTERETRQAELDQLSDQAARLESEISEKSAQMTNLEQDIVRLQKEHQSAKTGQSSPYVGKLRAYDQNGLTQANQTRTTTMQQRRQEVQDMFRMGRTVGELADHFNVDMKTIQRDAAALDIPLVGRGRTAQMDISQPSPVLTRGSNGTGNLDKPAESK